MRRLVLGVACLALWAAAPRLSHAVRQHDPEVQQRQLAEQIYQQIRDRYPVKNYSFENADGQFLATFQLDDGMVLTYNAKGHLVKRLEPDGYETIYEKGYPTRKVSPQGKIIWTIMYTWDESGNVKRTVRQQEQNTTVSYYDDQGTTLMETHDGPGGMVLRTGFQRANHQIFRYFEINASTGLTDMYYVSAVTGLLEEHWRITGGVQRIWDEKYKVFMELVLAQFHRDYADRTQFKKDSLGRTRGDILLKHLEPEKILPVHEFAQAMQEKRITFDDEWKYVDSTDLKITLPAVELVESEKVIRQKARVEGNKVMVWVRERLQWEVYPFDPREEELIPLNMRGDVRIESRFQKNSWQVIPGKTMIMFLAVRMIIPENVHIAQREKLSQHLHDDPDFDDLFTVMQQAAQKPTPTPAIQTGEAVEQFTREELDTFRIELAFQVKNLMQASPQLNQRDSFQKTQAELLLQTLTPEKVLSYEEFIRQRHCLRRIRSKAFDKIIYSKLEIFSPEIRKKKLYREIKRVRELRGIQVWKDDPEHPDKGYWIPYALRSSRDTLLEENGRLIIRVDEGKFQWEITPVWRGKIVSGEVFFAKPGQVHVPHQPPAVHEESAEHKAFFVSEKASEGDLREGGQGRNIWQSALPGVWHGYGMFGHAFLAVIHWMMQGQTGENIIAQKTDREGQEVMVTEIRNWHGKILGYARTVQKNGMMVSKSRYDDKKRLLSMISGSQEQYLVEYLTQDVFRVIRNHGKERQEFIFRKNRLETILLSDGKQFRFITSHQHQKMAFYDRAENLIYEKVFNQNGEQIALNLPDGEKIEYFYNHTKNILGILLENQQGQKASLVLNDKGQIRKHSGNGKLIYFASKQIDFLRPSTLHPLKIDFILE